MGPYKNGSYASGDKSIKLELVSLKDLKQGLNIEKVVFGKVVCWIQNTDAVPLYNIFFFKYKSIITIIIIILTLFTALFVWSINILVV